MEAARITIFAGHYGSGKTNLAINYALWLGRQGKQVALCDLDIVNPYFRTADSTRVLAENGIELIASSYANTNVDVPALPPKALSVFDNRDIHAVIDLGGDDRGALALGRYVKRLKAENNYEMLLVLNQYRPLTRDVPGLMETAHEIETAAQLRFTGLANNSNLGAATTFADVEASYDFTAGVAASMKLPVKMTALRAELMPESGASPPNGMGEYFPIEIYSKEIWRI